MEFVGIVAMIAAILGAFKLLHEAIAFLNQYIPEYSNFVPFIAFLGLFVGILILINLLGKLTKKLVDLTLFGLFDNLAGAIIGIFKWAFIISVLLWLFLQVDIKIPDKLTSNSFLYPYLLDLAPTIGQYIASVFPFAEDIFESVKELFH